MILLRLKIPTGINRRIEFHKTTNLIKPLCKNIRTIRFGIKLSKLMYSNALINKFIFTILLLTGVCVYSQPVYDSLLNVVESTDNDTIKINTYLEIGILLRKTNSTKAVDNALKALDIAKHTGKAEKQALCYYYLGRIYGESGDEQKSIENFNKSINLYESLNMPKKTAKVLSDLGFVYHRFDDYEKAMEMYREALLIYNNFDSKREIALALNRTGLAKTELGQFDGALEAHLQALKIYEEIGDETNIAAANNNIGNIYNRLGDNQKALRYYQTAIDYREKLGQKQSIIASLINIGSIYSNIYDYENALKSFNKALGYVNENTNTQWVVTLYIDLSNTFFDMKSYEPAIKNLKIAEEYARKYNYKVSISICKLNLGMIYLDMGENHKALSELNRGLPGAKQSKVLPLIAEFYNVFSQIYESISDYKKSYEYFELYSNLNDSIFNMESARQIAELQTKFESEKKDKTIALLQADNKIKAVSLKKGKTERNIYFIVFVFILLFLVVIISRYVFKTRTNKLLTEKGTEIERVNKELKEKNLLIKQQQLELEENINKQKKLIDTKDKFFSIIAHDLKNPFNAIIGMSGIIYHEFDRFDESTRIDFIKKINNSSKEVFKLVENLLSWSRARSGSLVFNPVVFNVSKTVKKALSVYSVAATNKNISISLNIDENLSAFADMDMTDTVIRNLVSNAVKFTPVGGKIEINAEKNGDYIKISVKDSGLGIDSENPEQIFSVEEKHSTKGTQNEKGTGLGLILCKEFVERNNGTIWVESKPGAGSTFYFTLPENKKD